MWHREPHEHPNARVSTGGRNAQQSNAHGTPDRTHAALSALHGVIRCLASRSPERMGIAMAALANRRGPAVCHEVRGD